MTKPIKTNMIAASFAAYLILGGGGLLLWADTAAAPSWRYFAAGDAENPQGVACITNGSAWALAVSLEDAESRTLAIVGRSANENAYLTDPAAGSTLDLRGKIRGAGDQEYVIRRIASCALGGDATRTTAAAVITPGTLEGDVDPWFRGAADACKVAYTSITIDEPNITGQLKPHLTPFAASEITWTIRVPKATSISRWAFKEEKRAESGFAASRGTFKEDSFLSVTNVVRDALGGCTWSGVLNLPVVECVGAYSIGGTYPGFGEIRLGAEARSVRSLETGACGWQTSGTMEVVVGLAEGNTVLNNAFVSLPGLRRVEFTGCPPNFAADAKSVFSGPKEKAVTFVVPPSAAWAAFLAPFEASGDFVRWSGDEVRAWRAEHPDGPLVIGTVAGSVFRCDKTQYLAVSDRLSSWVDVASLDFDATQGAVDVGTFEVDDAAPFNVSLRLTARATDGSTFLGWYGDVPDGKCADATLVLREADPMRKKWVLVRFARPWTLTAGEDEKKVVLDNGLFRIQATRESAAARTLTLGRGTACSLYAPDNTGDGILDLGGAIADADGNAYRITGFGTGNGPWKSSLSAAVGGGVPGARAFLSPGTLEAMEGGQFFHASEKNVAATYETIVFDEPTATGSPGAWCFADQTKLRRVVFRCPNFDFARAVGGMFYGTRASGTDVSWWKLDGVKAFGTGPNNNMHMDAQSNGTKSRLTGSLKLPAVTEIGPCAFQDNTLDEAWLGHGAARTRVVNIQSNAFDNAGITNLVLNAARNLVVGDNAFARLSRLKTVTFLGHVVSEAAFAAIFAGTAAPQTLVAFASDAYGWGQAPYLSTPTDDELAAAPSGARVLGVWRDNAGRVVLICHRDSPFPRRGAYLVVR